MLSADSVVEAFLEAELMRPRACTRTSTSTSHPSSRIQAPYSYGTCGWPPHDTVRARDREIAIFALRWVGRRHLALSLFITNSHVIWMRLFIRAAPMI